jgi:hypothetical protein
MRLVRVPNLTVTVRDPDALVAALDGGVPSPPAP